MITLGVHLTNSHRILLLLKYTAVDESWNKMAHLCSRELSPRLGFVAETGSFVTVDALSTIFLLFALLPSLLFLRPSVASAVQ